jgi:heme exporter protein C
LRTPPRAAVCRAVLSVFGFVNIVIVWKSIEWWNTLHPRPVLDIRTGGGAIDPAMQSAAWWNVFAIALLSVVLVAARMWQEETRREVDAMRRLAHTI